MCTEYIKVEHKKKKEAKLFSLKLPFVVVIEKIMFRLRFFFSFMSSSFVMYTYIYVSPMVALLGSQQEGPGV